MKGETRLHLQLYEMYKKQSFLRGNIQIGVWARVSFCGLETFPFFAPPGTNGMHRQTDTDMPKLQAQCTVERGAENGKAAYSV